MTKISLHILLGTFLFLLPAIALAQDDSAADQFRSTQMRASGKNPGDVSFSVRTKNNQTRFRVGETIALELSFSSTIPKVFVLDNASYDRSGRLDIDKFIVDPQQGTADPLDDYFNGYDAFIGGGIRGFEDVQEKPRVVTADLNEWIRFDTPGRYRLYISSGRVSKKRDKYKYGATEQLSIVSNVIEIEIVPADMKWRSLKIGEAREKLALKDYQAHYAGCRALRFLGTEAAVKEIIRQLGKSDPECDSSYRFGLIGSPHRAFVIREMERALISSDYGVSTSFLDTLELLASADEAATLPDYPISNPALEKVWQAKAAERRENRRQVNLGYLRQLAASVPLKSQDARSVSVKTLLDHSQEAKGDTELEESIRELSGGIPDFFERMPFRDQMQILQYRWRFIARERMLPILKGLLNQPDRKDLNDDYERRELRSLALKRIYEISPEEGRALIIEDVRRPKPRANVSVLGILPDETLPEVDDALLSNFERSIGPEHDIETEPIADLIERYASSAISSQVQSAFETRGVGKWACRIQRSLLAYLLRVNEAAGGDLLTKALAARGIHDSGCYLTTITDVAELRYTPKVEEEAVQMLAANEPELVGQAAGVLRKFGSAEVEEKLWSRFERWHESAKSKAPELRKQHPGLPVYGAPPLSGEAFIEQALRAALMVGNGWLMDKEELKRLRALCLTEECEREVNNALRGSNQMISLAVSPESDEPYLISIAHYQMDSMNALKKKLLQFPRETRFIHRIDNSSQEPERLRKIFADLQFYIEKNGMKLERIE